jgi:poly(A) polymerase
LLEHPRFRAAYDLLILREGAGEPVQELHTLWVKFYSGTREQREILIKEVSKGSSAQKRKRRPRKRKPNNKPKMMEG